MLSPVTWRDLPLDIDVDDDGVPDYTTQYQSVAGRSAAVLSSGLYAGLLMAGNENLASGYSGLAVRGAVDCYAANDDHIRRIVAGSIVAEVDTNNPTGSGYKLYFYDDYLFRLDSVSSAWNLYVYDADSLVLLRSYLMSRDPIGYVDFQFAIYDGILWVS